MNTYIIKNFDEKEANEQRKLTTLVKLYDQYDRIHCFIHMEYVDEENIKVSVLNRDFGYLIDQFFVNEKTNLKEENISPYEEIVQAVRYCYTPYGDVVNYGSVNHKQVVFSLENNNTYLDLCKWRNHYCFVSDSEKIFVEGVKERKTIFA